MGATGAGGNPPLSGVDGARVISHGDTEGRGHGGWDGWVPIPEETDTRVGMVGPNPKQRVVLGSQNDALDPVLKQGHVEVNEQPLPEVGEFQIGSNLH